MTTTDHREPRGWLGLSRPCTVPRCWIAPMHLWRSSRQHSY